MKNAIIKTVVVCTMALSLLIAGIAVIESVDASVEVCHDGPHKEMIYY